MGPAHNEKVWFIHKYTPFQKQAGPLLLVKKQVNQYQDLGMDE